MSARALRAWLPQGLAFRMGMLVFSASLFTSIAIAWVSVESIESFLRERIDRKFPELLRNADDRLAFWYRQREIDLEVFARSPILVEGLAGGDAGQAELTRYLSYVLEDFPHFESLLLIDPTAAAPLSVGASPELPTERLEELVAGAGTRTSRLVWVGDRRIQLVSTSISGERPVTLSGVLRLSSLDETLSDVAEEGVLIAVLDAAGTRVAGGHSPKPSSWSLDQVSISTTASGERLVASALRVDRLDWTLLAQQPYDVAFAPVSVAVRRALIINLFLAALSSLLAFALGAWRVRPIHALAEAARQLAQGDPDVRVPVTGSTDEVQRLGHSFNEMAERLAHGRELLEHRNRELEQANEVLEQLSITDGLTKLHNHRHFQDHYAQEAKRSLRTGSPLALLLVDIDDFKHLNDELGHHAGDRVLEAVAHAMNEQLRETDYLARYGGEEFAMLLPGTDTEGATILAEKVRAAISSLETAVVGRDGGARVTASIGVARFSGTTGATFERADRALYAAKAAGKDNVQVAADGFDDPPEATRD